MDKRVVRTQLKAEQALLELMQTHSFATISITDIAQKAEISRMAFYRHYKTKEDVLTHFIKKEYDTFVLDITKQHLDHFEQLLTVYLAYFKSHPKVLAAITNASLEGLAMAQQQTYLTAFFKLKYPSFVLDSLTIAYYSGAIFATLLYWQQTDYLLTAAELAAIIVQKFEFISI